MSKNADKSIRWLCACAALAIAAAVTDGPVRGLMVIGCLATGAVVVHTATEPEAARWA